MIKLKHFHDEPPKHSSGLDADIRVANMLTELFPLFTTGELAKRWKVSIQVASSWAKSDKDFPKHVEGIVLSDHARLYPRCEVERYEKLKKLGPYEYD